VPAVLLMFSSVTAPAMASIPEGRFTGGRDGRDGAVCWAGSQDTVSLDGRSMCEVAF
jgi:hypothetical protein